MISQACAAFSASRLTAMLDQKTWSKLTLLFEKMAPMKGAIIFKLRDYSLSWPLPRFSWPLPCGFCVFSSFTVLSSEVLPLAAAFSLPTVF